MLITARDNVVLYNNDNDHSLAIIRSYATTLNTLNYTRHSINQNEGELDDRRSRDDYNDDESSFINSVSVLSHVSLFKFLRKFAFF